MRIAVTLFVTALAVFFGSAVPAAAQSVEHYTNTTDSMSNAVSETAAPCSNPFTRSFSVGSSSLVSDVNVGVLMSHTYRGDLVMTLVSPTGTRVTLTPGSNSNSANNFNATFDDEAGSPIASYSANDTAKASTTVPPYNGTYRPASGLSAFDGQTATGTWTLEICDQYAGDSGTFYQADLYLAVASGEFADLSLAMTPSSSAPSNGAPISYTLTVSSASSSTSTASGITVSAPLPNGATLVGVSGTGTYDPVSGTWYLGSLAPGQSATLVIAATVNATAGATVSNVAEISASTIADIDSTPANGANNEDDLANASFTVSGTRTAGTAPMLICPAGTSVFDWDAISWSNGNTSGSYAVSGIGLLGIAISNSGTFLNNTTYGGQSPTRQNVVTGGLASPQYSLMQLVDLSSQADEVSTTITLPAATTGAQFTIFDVDYASGQFADRVTVTGSLGGSAVVPTLTNGVVNYVIGNSAYGDATSGDTQANGNVTVTFASPVDAITIRYGDHALAPANPGQQAITLHDITMCTPSTTLSVTKVSSVISDPVNGSLDPKAIPGAVIEYCVVVTNSGSGAATNVVASDTLPTSFTFAAGTLLSGSSCAGATTAEDENSSGADESDPIGASVAGGNLTVTAGSLTSGLAFAIRYRGTIN